MIDINFTKSTPQAEFDVSVLTKISADWLRHALTRYTQARVQYGMPSMRLFTELFGAPLAKLTLTHQTCVWAFSNPNSGDTVYALVDLEGVHFYTHKLLPHDDEKVMEIVYEIIQLIEQNNPEL